MIKRLFVLIIFLQTVLFSQDLKHLNFAPLPTKKINKNIQDFVPLSSYLNDKLNIKFSYIKKKDYKDIIDSFKDSSIDVAFLGPLPLAYLMHNYDQLEILAGFKQKNGLEKYRCVIGKFSDDVVYLNRTLKVALTQPLSTCGFYMTNKLLKKVYNVDLNNQKYSYEMSHTKALLSAISGKHLIAGAKESIADKHKSLGFKILAKSDLLPGFALVINKKTVSKEDIKKIKETILNIPDELLKSWGGVLSNGLVNTSIDEYRNLDIDFSSIPFEGNMNEN